MEVPHKFKNRTTIDPGILLDNFLKKTEALIQKGYTNSYVHYSNIYNSWDMELTKYPFTDEWIKDAGVCVCMKDVVYGTLLNHK